MAISFQRYLPRLWGDRVAFCFLLFSIHAVAAFELFYVLPSIYSSAAHLTPAHGYSLYYFHIAMGVYIYCNVVINLYKVMTTNTTVRGKILPTVLKPGGWHFCVVCECNVPPRAFHCHNCNICILKRDHHCTFTGNCIGLFNHRYYTGLVFFMSAAAGYSCVLNLDFFYHLFGSISFRTLLSISFPLLSWIFVPSDKMNGLEVFMTSLTLVGFLLSTGLLIYHLINACNGQTVHEKAYNIHTYDLGWRENIKLIMGTHWKLSWMFPLISSPVPCDGLDYMDRQQNDSIIKSM